MRGSFAFGSYSRSKTKLIEFEARSQRIGRPERRFVTSYHCDDLAEELAEAALLKSHPPHLFLGGPHISF